MDILNNFELEINIIENVSRRYRNTRQLQEDLNNFKQELIDQGMRIMMKLNAIKSHLDSRYQRNSNNIELQLAATNGLRTAAWNFVIWIGSLRNITLRPILQLNNKLQLFIRVVAAYQSHCSILLDRF